MATSADNVRVGITGELFVAPPGSTRPTDSSATLDAAYEGLGYVSVDGVSESHNDSVTNIVAWQNAQVVRAARSESVMTLSMTLIETKGKVLELFHPGSTVEAVGSGEWKLEVPPPTADRRQFVLNVVDGDKVVRIDVGNGEVTSRGEISYANGSETGYQITITCYPDADGLLAVKYSDDPAWGYS